MAYVPPAVNEYWIIGFDDEATYKAIEAIANVKRWIGILDEDQDLPIPEPEYEQFYGRGNAKPLTTVEGKRNYPGKLKWKVQNFQLIKNMMGKLVTTGPGGNSEYTHTFSCGTALTRPLPSINLAFWFDKNGSGSTPGIDDIYGRAIGVKLDGATYTFEQGQALICETPLQATSVRDEATAFPTQTPITTKPYMMKELGTITAHGLTIARIMSGSITFGHQLEPFNYGQADPFEHIEGRMIFDAQFTYVIQDDDFWDFALADPTASTTIDLTFTRGTYDTLQFDLSGAYPKYNLKKGAERELQIDVPYKYEDLSIVGIDLNTAYPL